MKGRIVRQLYLVAVPSTVMMSLPSILIGVLNGILGAVSQTAVAVLGVYFKLQMFVYMPANGIIQGMRPIISYNYGAGAKKRLHETIKVSVLVTAVIMAVERFVYGIPGAGSFFVQCHRRNAEDGSTGASDHWNWIYCIYIRNSICRCV